MLNIHVFLGPTLSAVEASATLDAVYHPPVAQGDVTRICDARPSAIAIIDGYFESVPAVWHKEILFALSRHIPVFGASSMGALRAAELHPFGMIGVGAIFKAFRDGVLEDDDEVAVVHGPAELGYPCLSEAMVNIRRTLSDAASEGILTFAVANLFENIAKELPYRERGYARIAAIARDTCGLGDECEQFLAWLPRGRVDQKREDALLLLRELASRANHLVVEPRFHFERTLLWEHALTQTHRSQ